jgi:mono/diheme cytochrome c family protein
VHKIVILIISLLFLVSCSSQDTILTTDTTPLTTSTESATTPISTPITTTEDGLETIDAELIFRDNCVTCHVNQDPCETDIPPAQGPARLIEPVIRGGAGEMMSAWQGVLTEDEIEALVLWLSDGFLPAKPPERIVTAGPVALLYWDYCGSCHGDFREGAYGPALTPERLGGINTEILKKVISKGISNTIMPPWEDILTDQEINDIIEYILSPVD